MIRAYENPIGFPEIRPAICSAFISVGGGGRWHGGAGRDPP